MERTVLLLHDLTAAIADLIPNSTDDMTTRHIAELVAAVELNRQSIRRLMTKFSKHPIAAVHDTAEAEIEALGSEIERMERELDELRCGVQMIEHKDQKNLLTRFREAKILMRSDDENERFLARSKIAQELRRVIEALVLHEDRNDRRVTVQIKLGSEGRIDYELTPHGIERICVVRRQRTATFHGTPPGLWRLLDSHGEVILVTPYLLRLLRELDRKQGNKIEMVRLPTELRFDLRSD